VKKAAKAVHHRTLGRVRAQTADRSTAAHR